MVDVEKARCLWRYSPTPAIAACTVEIVHLAFELDLRRIRVVDGVSLVVRLGPDTYAGFCGEGAWLARDDRCTEEGDK